MSTRRAILFPKKFPAQLNAWSEEQKRQGKPGSQYEFAKQVGVPAHYVSDWKSGRQGIPHTYIPKICEVLGVTPDVYEPKTHDEKYKNVREYITERGKEIIAFAKDRGLVLDCVDALSKIIDFDSLFPVYAPIARRKVNVELSGRTKKLKVKGEDRTVDVPIGRKSDEWTRSNNMDSAPIDKGLQFLQVERDGKTITMHRADLMFLKEVQDQIVEYVEYLFYKRLKEMDREVVAFNEDLTDDDLDEYGRVKPEYILAHDRFAWVFDDIYEDQETKKGE